MHLSLEELLALRDGEGTREAERHAESCPSCAERLRGLKEMRGLLRALPDPVPPRDLWPSLEAAARARRRHRLAIGAAAAAALLLATGVAMLLVSGVRPRSEKASAPSAEASRMQAQAVGAAPKGGPPRPAQGTAPAPGGEEQGAQPSPSPGPNPQRGEQAQIASLIRQSQRLERMLQVVEANPGVQSGWQAAAVTDLQDHLASLDGRIVVAGEEGKPREMVGLWQRRVDLLKTLLQVQTQPQGQVRL
jgi:hypothetical protein